MNKVLVVDDNPLVIGVLRQAIAPLATVSTAANGADALSRAAEDPPDLIVSDFLMPSVDGRQLLEKLRAEPATARIPMVLVATRSDIDERLKPLRDEVEAFLEKPFFVADARACVKRVLDKIALERMARAGETVVRGSLAQMNVIDLLQSLELGRKTCALVLTSNGDRCELFFDEGQINNATYGDLCGDEAVYKALAWTGAAGNFQIDFSKRSAEQTTTRSTQGLLMEGLRLLDEANRDAEQNS
jgi:CheY-like chemotaxis protein